MESYVKLRRVALLFDTTSAGWDCISPSNRYRTYGEQAR